MDDADDTLPLPHTAGNELFEFGENTILKLQTGGEDFGTLVIGTNGSPAALPKAVELVATGTSGSLEEKVDALARSLLRLEQRLASIDATLARLVSR